MSNLPFATVSLCPCIKVSLKLRDSYLKYLRKIVSEYEVCDIHRPMIISKFCLKHFMCLIFSYFFITFAQYSHIKNMQIKSAVSTFMQKKVAVLKKINNCNYFKSYRYIFKLLWSYS